RYHGRPDLHAFPTRRSSDLFQQLTWRMAISLTPKSGKQVVGVVEMKGHTDVDNVAKVVVITNPEITGTYFPSLDPATKEKTEQLDRKSTRLNSSHVSISYAV